MILKDWIKLDRQTIEGSVIRNHGKGNCWMDRNSSYGL